MNKWIKYGGLDVCNLQMACEILMLQKGTVYKLISQKRLCPIKINNRVFFSREEIEKYQNIQIEKNLAKVKISKNQ